MIPPSADDEKKKARAERFGAMTGSTGATEEDKKKSRLERFGMNPINHYNLDTGRVITNSMANKRVKDN
jgi:Tho1/MOS11 C-terminal domain